MSAAVVHPFPMTQPTGAELMSTPIKSGGMSRKDKEFYYVVRNINQRLSALSKEEIFNRYKVKWFSISFLSALIGIIMILVGNASTVLFESQKFNPVTIAFGGLFCLPLVYWTKLMVFPSKNEHQRRKSLRMERGDAKERSLYEKIAYQAQKYATPAPTRVKVYAHLRKKDYLISASTWKEFCEELEHATGLPPEQQIIKFNAEELKIDLLLKLDEHYGLKNGDRLHIYNRGGFLLHVHSPVKHQYDKIQQEKVQVERDRQAEEAKYNSSWMDQAVGMAMKSSQDEEQGGANEEASQAESRGESRGGSRGGGSRGGGSRAEFRGESREGSKERARSAIKSKGEEKKRGKVSWKS